MLNGGGADGGGGDGSCGGDGGGEPVVERSTESQATKTGSQTPRATSSLRFEPTLSGKTCIPVSSQSSSRGKPPSTMMRGLPGLCLRSRVPMGVVCQWHSGT